MSGDLLQTKLYLPRLRPSLVPRPRLIETLNHGLAGKLTLISAPAGFGKTTLISSWIDALQTEKDAPSPAPIAWLSLDENDSELARFLAYVIAALQRIDPQIGASALPLLQASPLPVSNVLTTLLNDIAQQPESLMLVLDDYHAVDSQAIDEALTFLLDNLPPQLHLVITSREDPNLPLARLRVRGLLTELRAADLRFTVAETAVFLQKVMGLNLTEDQIAALETRTEGWVAGLQMAALSMRGQEDVSGFIQSFTGSHRFVLDYLLEEVLHQQPEHVQEFLLKTAVLTRLTGSLCDALTGDDNGQEILESLERNNLFIVPLDDQRVWYRYHHLFANVLQAYDKAAQPDQIAILHQQASTWYAQHGLPAEAVRHALAIDDYEQVATLAELTWRDMDRRYQSATWLGWVKALPDEFVRVRPVLSTQYAWALLDSGEMEAAETRLRDAERWLDMGDQPKTAAAKMVVVDEAEFQSLPITVANARAYLAQTLGDAADAVQYAQQALDLPIENDPFEHGLSTLLLGFGYWASGDMDAAFQTVSDAMSAMWTAGNIPFAISFTSYLADIMLTQGRLHEAVATYENALQRTTAQGKSEIPETAVLHLGLSELHLEQGDMAAAERHLLKSQNWGEQPAFPPWHRHWARTQARLKVAQGDLDGAVALLNEGETLYFRHPVPDICPLTALKARVWLLQGKLTEAQTWAHEQGLSAADTLSYLREFEHITLARLRIAQYKRDGNSASLHEAADLLARLLADAEAGRRIGSVVEILMLQALVYEAQHDTTAALGVLARALTLAEPAGYIRIFVDEGLPMAQLLSETAVRGIMPAYCEKLLAVFAAEGHPIETETSPAPAQSLVDPLTKREMEILSLIATGLKNKEIAATLFISLNTVHYHTKNLYSKLGVNSRTQAITRAKELNLLA